MDSINLIYTVGFEVRALEVSLPSGTHGRYQVYIDNFYQGVIYPKDGNWLTHFNHPEMFSLEDIQIMGEAIESTSLIP
jgi:hypothetical protein